MKWDYKGKALVHTSITKNQCEMENTIAKIQFDFQMSDTQFVQNLYAHWDAFSAQNIEKIADEVLQQYSDPGEVLEIDHLELDLGQFEEDNFEQHFPLIFREKLGEALLKLIHKANDDQRYTSKLVTTGQYTFDLLTYFLLHGTLPYTAGNEYKNISALFLEVLQKDSAGLKKFLFTYGHYTSLQQRLVYQLSDPELEKGVHLLQPGEGGFICSYASLLRKKYKEVRSAAIREHDYRNTVWFVIYSYLLSNSSSYFSRKHFVTRTIMQLGAKYNISFDRLLYMITAELRQFVHNIPIPPDLLNILSQLREELTEKQFRQSFVNGANLYKALFAVLQHETKNGFTNDGKAELIRILSRPDSCRLFLQRLTDNEITGIVPVVVSAESQFVIQFAGSLEVQKGKGALQGKAGSEFRLIKWQVIFSVLLTDRNTAFNRKYFVRNVLQQISAHYNIEFSELLYYICGDVDMLKKTDKNLVAILHTLYEEINENKEDLQQRKEPEKDILYVFLKTIREQTFFSGLQQKQFYKKIGDGLFRQKMFDATTEKERLQLIAILFPASTEYITGYIQQLDLLRGHADIAGRSGGDFSRIKWDFLLDILSRIEDKSFNQLSFVSQTLHKIAAYYNTTYFDLLCYFRQQESAVQLPYSLQKLFDKLYIKEAGNWTERVAKTGNDTDKFRFISAFTSQQPFVKQYIELLGILYKLLTANGKSLPDFHRIKWQVVFDLLLKNQQTTFSEEKFIRLTLASIAAYYQIPVQELYSYLNTDSFPASRFGSIVNIVKKPGDSKKTIRYDDHTQHMQNKPSLFLYFEHLNSKEKEFADKLSAQADFISYAQPLLELIPLIRNFFAKDIKTVLPDKLLIDFLLQLSAVYRTLSRTDLINRFIDRLQKMIPPAQQNLFFSNLEKWSNENATLRTTLLKRNDSTLNNKASINPKKEIIMAQESLTQPLHLDNAGMVIMAIFLPRLFTMLKLTEGNKLKDKYAQQKAVLLIQYAILGKTDFPEHELALNKIFAGLNISDPVPANIELTDDEKATVMSMLEGVKSNWQKMKNASIEALRQAFFQREGKLEEKEDHYYITVEEKAYDMLLDSIPWNFRMIKFPWMEKRIEVKWR